jgi:hypothetical protein
MPHNSPTVEGFRAAFRRPSFSLAEIMWRWSAGTTVAALVLFGLFEFLDTLPVTNGELLFLRTRHPYLVGEAIAHILRGSLSRAVMASLLGAMMLVILWIVAASVGRVATVRGLLDYFRLSREVAGRVLNGRDQERDVTSYVSANEVLPALVRINFLRVVTALAALCGFVGASILAGFASPDTHPKPGLAFLLFLPMAVFICVAWWALNWLLSLSGIFAVRDGEDAVGSIAASVVFVRERLGPVFAVSTWTGLAHLVAFVGATTVVSIPLGFAGLLPWRLVIAGMICATLGYFALADWLYIARLAGYVFIAETPEALLSPTVPPLPRPAPPIQTTIDRDEPILSDLPNLALET